MHRIHFTPEDLLDSERSIIPRSNSSAKLFHRIDRLGAGARHDDVDGCVKFFFASGEELDAVFDAMDAFTAIQLFEGDGLGGVEAALVDPVLDFVEVDGGHVY